MVEPGIHRIDVTTLGDLLDLRAAEQGERPAMVFPDHQVTYAGLAQRADFFARHFPMERTVGIHLFVPVEEHGVNVQSRMFAPTAGPAS